MRRLLVPWLIGLALASPALADSGEALFARLAPLDVPKLDADDFVIAFGEEATFILAGLNLAADTHDHRSASALAGSTLPGDDVYFDAGLALRYDRFHERRRLAYRIMGHGRFAAQCLHDHLEVFQRTEGQIQEDPLVTTDLAAASAISTKPFLTHPVAQPLGQARSFLEHLDCVHPCLR